MVGAYFTILNIRALERQIQISKEGQITERFTGAVEQLGNENPVVCLGGVYALERIAYDSQRDHWTIMEILTTFVRDKATWKGEAWNAEMSNVQEFFAIDSMDPGEASSNFQPRYPQEEKPPKKVSLTIQTIMIVMGRRSRTHEKNRLNLRKTDLPKIELRGASLTRADFTEAHLDYADFTDAQLTETLFENAHLVRSKLVRANLSTANLASAHLELADLESADLKGAKLTNTYLLGADLKNAELRGANLFGAYLGKAWLSEDRLAEDIPNEAIASMPETNLEGADLRDAILCDTNLVYCKLKGADLRGTNLAGTTMKREQLELVIVDNKTKLPERFVDDSIKKS